MYVNALDHVLRAVRLTQAAFANVELSASRPVRMPASSAAPEHARAHVIYCHLVAEGECVVISNVRNDIRLRAGDVVAFPHGAGHSLQAAGARSIKQSDAIAATLICGTFVCETDLFGPLITALPEIIRCPKNCGPSGAAISDFYLLCENEAKPGISGAQTTLARLGEALFAKIVFAHFESMSAGQYGWLAGLRDRQVSQAILLLHAQPHREWTLCSLSREAGMSRSALADRFARFVGVPPIHYLALWRMHLASGLILSGKSSIAKIAAEVGYESEAAFSRAFKKIMGIPPAAWRRSRHGVSESLRIGQDQPGRPVLALARLN